MGKKQDGVTSRYCQTSTCNALFRVDIWKVHLDLNQDHFSEGHELIFLESNYSRLKIVIKPFNFDRFKFKLYKIKNGLSQKRSKTETDSTAWPHASGRSRSLMMTSVKRSYQSSSGTSLFPSFSRLQVWEIQFTFPSFIDLGKNVNTIPFFAELS